MKLEVGKFYTTRGGQKAKIYDILATKIHGTILDSVDNWILAWWSPDGVYKTNYSDDIVDVWHDPQTRKLWINVYHNHETIFDDKDMADRNAGNTRMACKAIEITFKQGDGL